MINNLYRRVTQMPSKRQTLLATRPRPVGRPDSVYWGIVFHKRSKCINGRADTVCRSRSFGGSQFVSQTIDGLLPVTWQCGLWSQTQRLTDTQQDKHTHRKTHQLHVYMYTHGSRVLHRWTSGRQWLLTEVRQTITSYIYTSTSTSGHGEDFKNHH